MKVSSASTISLKLSGLVGGRSAQKPMPPAKRRRRMHPAKLGRLGQAFAFNHRPGVIEPTLPFVQMRHRRLGEPIEGAPATLAPEPRKPMRASPGDDRSSRAMGTALARHPLMAAGSQSIWTTTPLRAFVRRPAGRGGLRVGDRIVKQDVLRSIIADEQRDPGDCVRQARSMVEAVKEAQEFAAIKTRSRN